MRKIAAVIGSSGIGKSKLAVELCKALNGQVINADALQVYKGLDIITNKMPVNEREGIKHHLMDFLNPEEEYSVTEFLKDCSQKIESISEQSQLPVVVGGTNYYIQSLIWNNTLIGQRESSPALDDFPELDKLETSELYERLSKVDPVMANKWHPSDRRKILRSLKIYHQTGQPQSEIIKLQKEQNETEGLQPRYRSLIFWIYAEPSKLNPRLDERVDQMIETGLFDEIKDLRNRVVQGSIKAPGQNEEKYQRGLWQAIGYKEFDPYFNALEEGKEESEIVKIKDECTERMKAATRRYAKRQIQWIRNKLLPTVMRSKGDDVLVYLLDANDLSNWNINVKDKAITVAKAFQEDLPLPSATSLSVTAEAMLTPSDDAQE
ncbi:Putative tRNA dimethylallyltransferase [Rhizopus microsporus]|nr:Putative tRNA dimethylallyltransferase [Rhizopus microsporus]